ncbi:PREDICTED: perilipin-1-like [Polistes dominula]|uniref:Perilipin-1-like n=1 Tax=Polistes dominula TaxID=743375 RepID=A0ABM1HXX2_POLDO|nr:PREDICTED: perilipin-1-like [Polistes dominula]
MKSMDNSESSFEIKETPSSIVRIAYRQLSLMTGMNDLANPTLSNNDDKLNKKEEKESCIICTLRFFRLPIFVSVSSSLFQAYTTIKESHQSVTTIFESVENGFNKSAEYVRPLTNQIHDTLEIPIKTIDTFVCVGLDFMEEKVPSIKSPPYEIYQNISNNIRLAGSSVMKTFCTTFSNIVGYADRITTSMNKNEEKKDDKSNNVIDNVK